ncbi:MAG: 50S ribosomal protein L34e [Nanoarchaeota archaeon]
MPQGRFKSGSKIKVTVRAPGGVSRVQYRARKTRQPHCAVTGVPLPGIPRMTPAEARRAPKSSKRPSRPFGGVLSSKASRQKIKSAWR